MLLFLERGILSEMFYFKLLKTGYMWLSQPVNIKSEALNTFFYAPATKSRGAY